MAFEQNAVFLLEREGEKASLDSSWRPGYVAVFVRQPWEGVRAVSFAIANGEEAFESLKKDQNVALYFTKAVPFFLRQPVTSVGSAGPRKVGRDLCKIF